MTTPLPLIETLKTSTNPKDRAYWGAYLCAQLQLKRYLSMRYQEKLGLAPLPLPQLVNGAPLWIFAFDEEGEVSTFTMETLKALKEEDVKRTLMKQFWFCYQRAHRSETYIYWMQRFLELLLKVDPKEALNGWAALSVFAPESVTAAERTKYLASDPPLRLQMLLYPYLTEKERRAVLKRGLDANDPRALYVKAESYKYGNAYWRRAMEKAAKFGDPLACARWLGYLMEKDPTSEDAKEWLRLCEVHPDGFPVWEASRQYWNRERPCYDIKKAIALAERAASLGCTEAFYTSGLSHLEGFYDEEGKVSDELPTATPQRAALGYVDMVAAIVEPNPGLRSAEAAGALANDYLEGHFVTSDPLMVAYLVAHAAIHEDVPEDETESGGYLAWWLYTLYRDGFVFKQDDRLAQKWLMVAAERHHPDAIYNAGIAFELGQGVEKDPRKALDCWFSAWTRFRHVLAAAKMGVAYQNGAGCEANPKAAAFLFNEARKGGVDEALLVRLGRHADNTDH